MVIWERLVVRYALFCGFNSMSNSIVHQMSHWVVELFQDYLIDQGFPTLNVRCLLAYTGNISHGAGQPIGNLSKGYHARSRQSFLELVRYLSELTSHLIDFIRNKLYIRGRLSYRTISSMISCEGVEAVKRSISSIKFHTRNMRLSSN